MLNAEEARQLLELALKEFDVEWDVVGDCSPISIGDQTHWPSGARSFHAVLRRRDGGAVKVLGRRRADDPSAVCHRAVSAQVLDAYRDRMRDPVQRYFDELGLAPRTATKKSVFARQLGTAPAAPAPQTAPRSTAAAPARDDRDLRGSFATLGFVEVLQAVALAAKSGRLAVCFARDAGMVVIDRGAPIHVEFAGQTGEKAFVRLLARSQRDLEGRFLFTPSEPGALATPRSIDSNIEHLLVFAATAIDEERAAESGAVAVAAAAH